MCSLSEDRGATTNWCGNGWTGQPAVFERDGRTWVVFGAYDRAVHFVDAATGEDILPPFLTGDIIKGSVTIDPDGFPLVYIGSRDNKFRVLAFDRPEPTELWKLDANEVSPTMWNDDWDGSGLVLHDCLFEGGENSQIHAVKLNRGDGCRRARHRRARARAGTRPGGTTRSSTTTATKCRSRARSRSPATRSTSATRAVSCRAGTSRRCSTAPVSRSGSFRFWTGDDTDGTIVVDERGILYVGSEWERTDAHVGRRPDVELDPRAATPTRSCGRSTTTASTRPACLERRASPATS